MSSQTIGPIADIDRIIRTLLSLQRLSETDIQYLCYTASLILLSQPTLLNLEAPMNIIGDISGQYHDLLTVFARGGCPPEANYLFLGNFVGNDKHSLETACLVLAFKIKFPENFFILRGNQECALLRHHLTFYVDFHIRYSNKLWDTLINCFNCLPLAAIISEKIFAVHGGLSPELTSMSQIQQIMRPTDIPGRGLLRDLLHSHPDQNIVGWTVNLDNGAVTFGPEVVYRFVKTYDFDLICCGSHKALRGGYEFIARRHLGRGEEQNDGAMMAVDKSLMCRFTVIKATKIGL
ncbi:Metallo-dependent phosphatase [Mytilinidion resinicola]|uniref:protein-serine/threonine phosphatase n=1 Tax=Mytilinidion resinicola TaxID=574789 RepID=A0A6A6YZG0_9PEZI|nr:Metallo-dependent phosphatase [Mytilinidion resinicola]KAF2814221.1 Metallo-dependent phosphatase [Mytilinidion resinicola]